MNKQPGITERTKQTIATAFCDLYMKKSINKITIKEITVQAGYNRCTFYQYFTDIYDLLNYIENDLLTAMKQLWKTNSDSLRTPDLEQLLLLFEDKAHYLKAVFGDYGSIHFLERLKRELPLDEIKKSFPQEEKLFPYLLEFHIATSLSLFRVWLKNGKDIPSDVLFELIHNLYINGISSLAK
ncbi:probable dihydroxyacetone kinase regulator [uncultured Roseburia sp.]|uniref:TetR/AcrR family transcriptional regulator n=1 Tax=Brotonthovivens ammoniilytica TaxID=2981725 RepID=A0ABT2THI8_9FIRM|nr:TetR/AcrR family transcriptional regulator [Brotonthovivens ammoniilytica]MCU6761577.1 TetR/AcrR family transcriptional regulator [Brotonthovivens ammoniilytica]SCI32509.1 probable dihydroxyacetone kinase regulator [uncultured Roseburia sp.]